MKWWGGGIILPHEVEKLHTQGITKIYTRRWKKTGLMGMVALMGELADLIKKFDI